MILDGIFDILDYAAEYFKNRNREKPIGIVNFAWCGNGGEISFQSTTFYMNKNDTKRKIIFHGVPPKGYVEEDHLFYHKVVVPFLNRIAVDEFVSFDNKENTMKALDFLSGKSQQLVNDTQIKEAENLPTKTDIIDNVIYLDFKNTKHE